MLQTDDVDEDYFTPSNNATLANIFSNSSSTNYDNSSLKYVPPKPTTVLSATKPEDSKTSECTFACSLQAFEWLNDVYTPRGKVGFAILKMIKFGYSNILLYNSNKSTLSCVTIQPSLEVKIKGDTYISYYDNARRYWSLLGTSDDIKNILKALTNLNSVIRFSPIEDQPEPVHAEETIVVPTEDILRESDTDSSTNRKTKLSILNRMASMGQSVLPPQTIAAEKTSDSSDTNDSYEHHKVTRHKGSKIIFKKTLEKGATDNIRPLTVSKIEPENSSHLRLSDKQLLPIMTTDIISSVSAAQDVNALMAEQRQSNSELRINMVRLTDKMDRLLEKVNDIKQNEMPGDFQTTIYKKLLSEYEKKINAYEELIKSKGFDTNTSDNITQAYQSSSQPEVHNEIKKLEAQIVSLENTNRQKDIQIQNILREKKLLINQLSEKNDESSRQLEQDKISQAKQFEQLNITLTNNKEAEIMTYKAICEQEKLDLIKLIEELKFELSNKELELQNCKITCDKFNEARIGNGQKTVLDLEMKVKSIMNDTFQSIAANFNSDENYLGSVVKNTTAAVIKEVTLETLKAIKSDI